jgi:hypothetical protein
MRRTTICAAMLTGVLAVFSLPAADAQEGRVRIIRGQSPAPQQGQWTPTGARSEQPKKIIINPNTGAPAPLNGGVAPSALPPQPGYPYLDAPMYPVPRPDIPYQVGSAFITNQAFAPHEMLYPHKYHAMYPPFYYYVDGKWVRVKDCLKTHEDWQLHGTEVIVEYKSHLPLFSRFSNPFSFLRCH